MSEKVEIDSSQVNKGSYHLPRKGTTKWKILKYISDQQDGVTPVEIAKNLGYSLGTVRPYCQEFFENNLVARGAKYGTYYGITEVEMILLGGVDSSQVTFDPDLYKLLLAYENVHNLVIYLPKWLDASYDLPLFSLYTVEYLNTGRSLLVCKWGDEHGIPFDQIGKILGAVELFCQVHDIDYFSTSISRRELNVDHPGSMTEPRFIELETFAKTYYISYPKVIDGKDYVRSEKRDFFQERIYPTHLIEPHLAYARNAEDAHHILNAYVDNAQFLGKETRRLQTAVKQTQGELISAKNDLVDIASGIESNLDFAYDTSKEVEIKLKEIGSGLETVIEQTSAFGEDGLILKTSQLLETNLKEMDSRFETIEGAYFQSVENEGLLVSNLQKLSQVAEKNHNSLKEIGSSVEDINFKASRIKEIEENQETFRGSLNDQFEKLVLIDEKIDRSSSRVGMEYLLRIKMWTIDELAEELDRSRDTVNSWVQKLREKGMLQEKTVKQKRGRPHLKYKLKEN